MDFFKRQSIGFYMGTLTFIVTLAALIYAEINGKTAYFQNLGVEPSVLVCAIVAMASEIFVLVSGQVYQGSRWLALARDIALCLAAVLLVLSMVSFLASRINGFASIMTFEQNAQNMADLQSASIAIVLFALASVLAIVTSFFRVRKNTGR